MRKIFKITLFLLIQIIMISNVTLAFERDMLSPRIFIASESLQSGINFIQTDRSGSALLRESAFIDADAVEELLKEVEYFDTLSVGKSTIREDIRRDHNFEIERVLYIQNNRSGTCSGQCKNCYKHFDVRGNSRTLDPMPLDTITKIIEKAFRFNIRTISLNGEDSLDDWQSVIAIAEAVMDKKKNIYGGFGYSFHIWSNGFALINDLENLERKVQDLRNTGLVIRIAFSWDIEKVRQISKQNNWAQNQAITAMAKVIRAFKRLYPGAEVVIQTSAEEKDLYANKKFLDTLRNTVPEDCRQYVVWENKRMEFRVNAKTSSMKTWKDRFKQLVQKAKANDFHCNYNCFIDMATSTMSNCQVYSNNLKRKVTPDNFVEALIMPYRHPLTRHRYFGNMKQQGQGKLRELLFACCLNPEYWEKPWYFEQLETKIINNRRLWAKMGTLSLLRDIFLNYNTEDMSPPRVSHLRSFSDNLAPALTDGDVLEAYLRYVDFLRGSDNDFFDERNWVNHGFFNFYYVWKDFKQRRISDKAELSRRIANLSRIYYFEPFLDRLEKWSLKVGGEISSAADPDRIWEFFDKMSETDVLAVFKEVLIQEIIPAVNRRDSGPKFDAVELMLLNQDIAYQKKTEEKLYAIEQAI